MPNYSRIYQKGGTYFFTVVTERRQPIFREDAAVSLLDRCLTEASRSRPFAIDAMVILPDHLHTIWTLPSGDSDFSTRWNVIKGNFSRRYDAGPAEITSQSRLKKGERGIWQRRFWEHLVRDQHEFNRLCDYIHYNPVKHGLVDSAVEWKYSTLGEFAQRGLYPKSGELRQTDQLEAMGLERWWASMRLSPPYTNRATDRFARTANVGWAKNAAHRVVGAGPCACPGVPEELKPCS